MINAILSRYQAAFGAGLSLDINVQLYQVFISVEMPLASGKLKINKTVSTFDMRMACVDVLHLTIDHAIKEAISAAAATKGGL